jgi:hypothetical protein
MGIGAKPDRFVWRRFMIALNAPVLPQAEWLQLSPGLLV